MRFAHGRHFLAIGPGVDPVGPVEAGAVDHGGVVDHRVVDVRVVDNRPVNVQDGAVIGKVSAFPATAIKARSAIAEAVVHATVKADMGSPVTGMPEVSSATPAPVAGCPENTRPGSTYPGSGHPEVARIAVSPVSRRPKIAVPGTHRLSVNRQHRRSAADCKEYAGKRRRRHR